jgi:hypothetical protein
VWLFVSAFLWPHTLPQLINTAVCGAACVAFAIGAMAVPWMRHLNTALAIWLFISVWALPESSHATMWNNILVAIAIFVVSLVPSRPGDRSAALLAGRATPPPTA